MIEPWTNQTAAVAGLLGIRAQEYQRSVRGRDYPACLYRGPHGLKCYIGHIIPDELYDPRFEGTSAKVILCSPAIAGTGLFTQVDLDLVIDLVRTHDRDLRSGKESFELAVERIFKKYNLEYPAP